ncbi:MAG: calcium/sodium antiporter [Spirochaetales bacterium]|nr:calcium/sodium antiporter [Spirochaetales bacterium]
MELPIIAWFLIFPASLFVLIKASDFFTENAEKIGLMLGISPFIIGVTIVSIGTSLPELVSSLVAVVQGSSNIVAGNVVGSNIANILLILGFGAVIAKKLIIQFDLINVDVPILAGATILLILTGFDGVITPFESIIMILGFIIYIAYTVNTDPHEPDEDKKVKPSPWPFIIVVVSSGFIFLGAKFTVDSVIEISSFFGVGEELIAVTAVAFGTSLPELMVTLSAVKSGNSEMVVGNVLGSNIFNALIVIGVPGLLGNIVVADSILTIGFPVMASATILFFLVTLDKKIGRWEGFMLMLVYLFFIGKIFNII